MSGEKIIERIFGMAVRETIVKMLARHLKAELDGRSFVDSPRSELTNLVKQLSGGTCQRLGARQKVELENELLRLGVRCRPSLAVAGPQDNVTFFHVSGLYAHVLDLWTHATAANAAERGAILLKIKGRWRWGSDADNGRPAA